MLDQNSKIQVNRDQIHEFEILVNKNCCRNAYVLAGFFKYFVNVVIEVVIINRDACNKTQFKVHMY